MTDRSPGPDAATVSAGLARQIDTLVQDLLPAGRRNGRYWKVGSTANDVGGSMWVHLAGPKRGNWQDSSTGEFGDALDLVAACSFAGDKKRAYGWALSYLGLAGHKSGSGTHKTGSSVHKHPSDPAARAEADKDRDERRAKALAIWLKAEPAIAHTPVDAYLQARGLDLSQLGRQPRALRYHPALYHSPSRMAWPAMVAAISGPDGAHIATHRTWLERVGGGWIKARVEQPKMTFGDFAGGSIRLWRGASGKSLRDAPPHEPVVIGEGIETCLSIAFACPELRVLSAISLGNFGSVWLPDQVRMIVLAADNDLKPAARVALQKVVERHLQAGRHVRIARSPVGNDFNDVIRGVA